MDNASFVGLDVGYASVRSGIFDGVGSRLGLAERPIRQLQPAASMAGWWMVERRTVLL
jgi:ribulose kinase